MYFSKSLYLYISRMGFENKPKRLKNRMNNLKKAALISEKERRKEKRCKVASNIHSRELY